MGMAAAAAGTETAGDRWGKGAGAARAIGTGNVSKLAERQMISWQGRWEPHVVAHLDVERGFEQMRQRRVRVVKVTEVGSVDGCALEKSRWQWR